MHHYRSLGFAVSILLCFLVQAQCADKYTDENRPYEFGFNVEIEGNKQQHRHEKKDKDGIIMGEFGFVTADNVYHVTVYATDKDGRFKILSTKNIRLSPSPDRKAGPSSARQGHSLSLPDSPAAPPPAGVPASRPSVPAPPVSPSVSVSQPQTPFKPLVLEPPGRSCSSCSIPTTTVVPPPNFVPQNLLPFSPPAPALPSNVPQSPFASQPPAGQPNYAQQIPQTPVQVQLPSSGVVPRPLSNNALAPNSPELNAPNNNFPNVQTPNGPSSSGLTPNGPLPSGAVPNAPNSALPDIAPRIGEKPQGGSGRTSKQYTGPAQNFGASLDPASPQNPSLVPGSQPGPVKPTLVTAQMSIVDKNTDIHALRPGEQQGLPPGITTDDISQLLYTFNYTVGFHGHFEEGYTNGAKKGYYYVTGRNGVRTRIDYTADDTGFHPKVSQEVLDLLSEDVPKPETEKDAKYGLKGYEFKWLYFPADPKKA
ncbi:uncharacterized protein LOC142972955 isoform X2 [Anticarsia gemmatalis]